ncbi:MDR family MFS transporter [Paenibacillus nasutitermitis]|uniref:MFS transporter n=1 Tax=Paenibacillus nasutitermitis TaxID=1652958 RepID=A0A916ZCF9_9BACL|nr:MDR family MFS transporter [Paenibacillus nasutitermitis]GGD88504.1 MFS transporter [Paenibacillus nasutitermitis]
MEKTNSKLGFVVAGLLLSVLMSGMDNTIVATAMGTIVSDLGGFEQFVWLTSAYIVAEMAGMPLFGKFSDMYGRKRFFQLGLILFIVGSALCGMAGSIIELSIYRAIQGIGASAMIPIAHTIIFDVFPSEKRGKIVGLFGSVFGLATLAGPLLGGYITEYFGWEGIFYINLPIGIIAFVFIAWFYRESKIYEKKKIDWLGTFTLIPAIVCLMLVLELGGHKFLWNSGVIVGLFAVFVVLFIAFLFAEAKAEEPIIPFRMFKNRLFAGSTFVAFFYSGTFIICTIYLPIFVQGVLGATASNSGLILMPLMLGAVVAALLGGHLTSQFSYRTIMIASGIVFVIGIALLSSLSPNSTKVALTAFMIVTGLGMGSSFSVLTIAALHPFEHHQRGVASSTVSFLRSLGMTLGISFFGILQRNLFENQLQSLSVQEVQAISGDLLRDPAAVLAAETRTAIPDAMLHQLSESLSNSITGTFMWAIIPAICTFLFAFWISRERPDESQKISFH